MERKQTSFLNRPTCAIVLSIVSLVFVLSAFILSRTLPLLIPDITSDGEVTTWTANIEWSIAGIYLGFMLFASLVMFIKTRCCTINHFKEERTNRLLMANLVIEVIALIFTFVAAFGVFMYSKSGTVVTTEPYDVMAHLYTPYTVLSSLALGFSFFGTVTNLITLAK